MEASARRQGGPETRRGGAGRLIASSIPSLSPRMLLPQQRRSSLPFPFGEASAIYPFFARNGIYALARLWGLAGKEVLFPSYFHGVELEALLEAGVRPRFYPVHEKMRVDPQEVIAAIGPETRAVYLIHYLGFPAPVEEIAEACRERGVRLIEDCALALLSSHGDRPLGSFGDAAVFCLYKTLPIPNGGVLLVRDRTPIGLPGGDPPPWATTVAPVLSSLLTHMEVHGGEIGRRLRAGIRTVGNAFSRAMGAERIPTGTQHFNREHVGLAMSPICWPVIEAQDFPSIVERRRRNFFHLLGRLRSVAPPVFSELPHGVCPLFYPLEVENKPLVVERLRERGVDAIDFWRHSHPSVPRGAFPEVEAMRRDVLEIPCHQDLDPQTIDRVAAIVTEVVEELA